MFVVRIAALLVAIASGCGARSELVAEGAPTDAAWETTEAEAPVPTCTSERFTRPSTCSAMKECSATEMCTACRPGEDCVEGRCLHLIGVPLSTRSDLTRAFYEQGEGMECSVDRDGDLEEVHAGVFSDGKITAIVMRVFAECGGSFVLVATQRRASGSSLPWTLDPPIAVKKGARVRVLFHAVGSKFVVGPGTDSRAGLEQMVMRNVDSACRFISEDWAGLSGGPAAHDWDFLGQLAIHPR